LRAFCLSGCPLGLPGAHRAAPPVARTPGPMGISEMLTIQAAAYQQPCPGVTGRQVRRQPRLDEQQGQHAARPVPARRRGRAGQSAPRWTSSVSLRRGAGTHDSTARPWPGRGPRLVGVAGFEPAASSSRT